MRATIKAVRSKPDLEDVATGKIVQVYHSTASAGPHREVVLLADTADWRPTLDEV